LHEREERFHRGVIPGSTHSPHKTDQRVMAQGSDEFCASKLTTSVRVNDAPTHIPAPGDGVMNRVNSEAGFHPV